MPPMEKLGKIVLVLMVLAAIMQIGVLVLR
jgi:hypothetical protein